MDDENLRKAPEVEFLGGLLVFLTIRTIPGILRTQLLLAGVELQTLTQIYHLLLGSRSAVTRIVLTELLGGLLTEEL